VFGHRAGLAACENPQPPTRAAGTDEMHTSIPTEQTRAALWRDAGLQRDAGGLARLLDDPYPLARLIAASCLAREESRGAHQRTDRPGTDPSLDGMHTLVGGGRAPHFELWK
jgi:L-aspartate oxidase